MNFTEADIDRGLAEKPNAELVALIRRLVAVAGRYHALNAMLSISLQSMAETFTTGGLAHHREIESINEELSSIAVAVMPKGAKQ
jgi:hypothetical protein